MNSASIRPWLSFAAAMLMGFRGTLGAATLPSPAAAGTYSFDIKSAGATWTVHIHIPKGYQPETKPPLVLALHGAGGDGKIALEHDGWAEKSDAEGFVVVAPTALPSRPRLSADFLNNPRVWNSGQLNALSPRVSIDDVAFFEQLLDELKAKVPYDDRRVFAVGHSNGGGMVFRLAAEIPQRLAGVASVAGTMALDDPQPSKALPMLYIIGVKDLLVPLRGGTVRLPWGSKENPPVAEFLEKWAAASGCETTPKTVSDNDGVKRVAYPSKSGGANLTVIYLDNHGHHWPGAKPLLPESRLGPAKSKFKATDAIWEFFENCDKGAPSAD